MYQQPLQQQILAANTMTQRKRKSCEDFQWQQVHKKTNDRQ